MIKSIDEFIAKDSDTSVQSPQMGFRSSPSPMGEYTSV